MSIISIFSGPAKALGQGLKQLSQEFQTPYSMSSMPVSRELDEAARRRRPLTMTQRNYLNCTRDM